ncbi:MAG: glycosyltransferase family 4 protein [Candidatus Saccharimonadales bacterium]
MKRSKSKPRPDNHHLRVAMIAPPWLALPVYGYGGIELVIQGLISELSKYGVEVVLFANGARRLPGIKTLSYYKEELFSKIDEPYYQAPLQVMQTHLNFALREIEKDGDFDIIHDHNPYIGPVYFSLASRILTLPPVLHTFHGPPFSNEQSIKEGQVDNRPQLEFMNPGRLYAVCISDAMAKYVPKNLQSHLLPSVHNAVEYKKFPFVKDKKDYYITLARFTKHKNQELAARFAAKYKKQLRMAGTIAGIGSNKKLLFELSNPTSLYRKNEEFRYYSDKILPYVLQHPRITYTGNLGGKRKTLFIAQAKALLFPVDWEEPFGMAVIEALACGTPVVAMNRGAMSEIIEHGVNGFLADTDEEFFEYANRVAEIDPERCRESVERHFSAEQMAEKYIDRYEQILRLVDNTI